MANEFYTHGSFPSTSAPGSSAAMRAELDSITAGFDKLPVLASNAYRLTAVNGSSSGLFSSAVSTDASGGLTYTGTLTGSTGVLNIGSGQIYKDAGGNFGIGYSSSLPATNGGGSLSAGVLTARAQIIAHQTSMGVLEYSVASNLTTLRSYGATANTGAIAFNVGGGGGTTDFEAARINSSGNVGVGTSTPGARLDVRGGTTTLLDIQNTGGLGSQIRLFDTSYSAGISNSSGNLIFGAAPWSTERMRIDSSGNVGIGGTANASALLDVQSTTKGLRLPNMTTAQKNAISSPAAGLMVFDTTLGRPCFYSGSAWTTL